MRTFNVRLVIVLSMLGIGALLTYVVARNRPAKTDDQLAQLRQLQSTLENSGMFGHYEAGRLTVIVANASDKHKPDGKDVVWMIDELNGHAGSETPLDVKRRIIIMSMIRTVTLTSGFDSKGNHLLCPAIAKYLTYTPMEAQTAVWALGEVRDPKVVPLLRQFRGSSNETLRANVQRALVEQGARA